MKLLGLALVLLLLQSSVIGKKRKMKTMLMKKAWRDFQNDAVLSVEPIPPEFERGDCSCTCCEAPPAPLVHPKCPNDIVVAVDSSACFRDHHAKMMRFLKKLVRRISRTKNIHYGADESRLSLMQFSSDIVFPLELSFFENYTNPPGNKALADGIVEKLEKMRFLGEGAFLSKALNSTVDQIKENPRPNSILESILPLTPRSIVIVVTNGKSHPSITMDDIEYSIADLRSVSATVLPVAVTRECHGVQSDVWNEGLCPDTVILNKLAKVGRPDTSTFMEMNSHDTINDILDVLKACVSKPPSGQNSCNNCTCTCELPIGPMGPQGPKGEPGKFVQGDDGDKGEVGPKGSTGDTGELGPPGDKGETGDKGEGGPKGETGEDGEKGEPGDDGEKGAVGKKGEDGVPGEDGDKGEQGEKGTKGEFGEKGMTGDKGEDGEKGRDGDKGEVGPKGSRGDKGEGIKGEIGPPGSKGTPGGPGPKGSIGPKGGKGNPGLCGKPGPAGKPGKEGAVGINGADGEPGPPGRRGVSGEPGVPGDKGEPGDRGPAGTPGSAGLTGERGPLGPEGKRGHKGEKGEPSEVVGPEGLPGPAGPKGNSGQPGRDGAIGPEGQPGRQGPRGTQGEKGMPGVINIDELRPLVVEIVRGMLPGKCAADADPPPPGCHGYPIELVFLVDGSDSISREDFTKTKEWILRTIESFEPSIRKVPLQVFIVQFSDTSQIEVQQYINSTSEEIREEVHGIEQLRSGTKTYHALRFVNEHVYPKMRQESFRILITMTDGDASDKKDQATIDEARVDYNLMVAVGIGDNIDQKELMDFSKNGNVFNVNNFSGLHDIINNIVENICSGIGDIVSGTATSPPITTTAPKLPPKYNGSGCYEALSDVAFVMDGSSSVGEDGFALLRDFLATVVTEFQNIGNSGVQVAMIQYNDSPKLEFGFEQSTDKNAVLNEIDELKYLGGNTRTGEALLYLSRIYDARRKSSRSQAKQVAVVITDGRSQDDVDIPAMTLKDEGVIVFSIGVGEAELIELEEIASTPHSKFIFSVQDYAAISSIKDSLIQKVCRESLGTYIASDVDWEEEGIIAPEGGDEQPTDEERGDYDETSGESELVF